MARIALIVFGVLVASVLLLISPLVYDGVQIVRQRRALQSRSDYPQIAAACVTVALSTTNHSSHILLADPAVPPLLRSLSPRYMSVSSNSVTMEFHDGADHYGYRVRKSDRNAKEWTISWYTERGERLLSTITRD